MSGKYPGLWDGPKTVQEYIELLQQFPADYPVKVSTPAGGGIAVERRDFKGVPHVAIYGKNGGSYNFGENALTEEEYAKQSQDFLTRVRYQAYTSIHGDHRLYSPSIGTQASCYGTHYDRRVIERMVKEGLIPAESVDLERVARCDS